MAVTGAIFNSLSFGGVNSADYGIYITGEAVYNAPRRAVELVSAPARNGDIVIDQGRWENIEVQYPAGCFSDNTDFSEKISAFRNAIISQLGYQRLTDTYHPNEYRMAIYISGLEVQPANSNSAGEFDLIFNCKPQRWLTSGETAIAVTSGDTITNQTLYDASPLLEFTGAGNITINDYSINVQPDSVVGNIVLWKKSPGVVQGQSLTVDIDSSLFNTGDRITISNTYGGELQFFAALTNQYTFDANYPWSTSEWSGILRAGSDSLGWSTSAGNDIKMQVGTSNTSYSFTAGTASSHTGSVKWTIPLISNGTRTTYTITQSCGISYDGQTTITFYSALSQSAMQSGVTFYELQATCMSSIPTHDMVKYVDFEIGEAYAFDGSTLISINNLFEIGASLAVLSPGENVITYGSNVDDVKITPRWWQL